MLWRRVVSILLLFTLAAVLAGVNTWFTAARSTIPLALDTKVLAKEVRREKHEGKDDVCLLTLADLGQIQVDREVYDAVNVGKSLKKQRQSKILTHDGKLLHLHWSRDHHGMLTAMPMCLGVLAALLAIVLNASYRRKKHSYASSS